jgi:hypothetical protein
MRECNKKENNNKSKFIFISTLSRYLFYRRFIKHEVRANKTKTNKKKNKLEN